MSRWLDGRCGLKRAFFGAVAALLGICSVVFDVAAQVEKTEAVRGVVVDEAGMPVVGSRVKVHVIGREVMAVATANAEFTVEVPAIGNEMLLSARNESGELQGMQLFRANQAEPIRVTLRKSRELVVTVTDPMTRPIDGARVGVDVGKGVSRWGTIAVERTDESGRAVLRFPAEAELQNVFAIKRGVGMNFKPTSAGPLEPQTLVLGDNHAIQIRAIDDEGQPLAGVLIRPVGLGRFAFPAMHLDELRMVTDETGRAMLSMIPATNVERIRFDIELKDYTVIQPLKYDPPTEAKEITARLAPLVTLRGKVSGADGKPPVGQTEVYAAGAGYHPQEPTGVFGSRWRAGETGVGFKAICDANGAFELRVARNHYYALMAWGIPQLAEKGRIVSPIQMRVVGSASPVEELSFTLGRGTRIHGVATRVIGPAGQVGVLNSSPMELVWRDRESYAKLPVDQRLRQPEGKTTDIEPVLIQNVWTDREGRFEFFVPPGRYTLSNKYLGESKKIEVTDEAEIEVAIEANGPNPALARAGANPAPQPAAKVIDLAGRVVLQANREQGIADVNLRRIDIGRFGTPPRGASSPLGVSGEDGRFQMARVDGESLLICSTADGLLSGIVKILAAATEVTIPLTPTASVRGRLIDEKTKKPLVGQEIETSMRTHQDYSTNMGPRAITDARGEFVLTGLTPSWPTALQFVIKSRFRADGGPGFAIARSTTLKTVTPSRAEILEVRDLPVQEFQSPSVEQLIASTTRSVFVQIPRLGEELGRAELLGQPVLVFAAERGSNVCKQFFRLWYALDEEAAEEARKWGVSGLADRIVLLAVDTTHGNGGVDSFQAILDQAKLELPAADDAGLAVLQSNGDVLGATTGDVLSNDGKLDARRLVLFLRKHEPPLPDAEKLLADALAKAKREGKRVFVFQSVPLSAPSALISLWLESQRKLLGKDYVCVTIAERYAGGVAAIQRAGGKVSSDPWIAILDESGKRLAMSTYDPPCADADDFPSFAGQMEQALTATARTLTKTEGQTILRSLWAP